MRQAVRIGHQESSWRYQWCVLGEVSLEASAIIRAGGSTYLAAGHTRQGTDEMDFGPVCVDDCRAVVCRATDPGGEGARYARRLGDRGCARTCVLVHMGGVHTACDWSGQTVPVDGAEVRTSHSDPYHRVALDGAPGICHRIFFEPWTFAVRFSHHGSRRAPLSLAVRGRCSLYELYRHPYVLVSRGLVSGDPLLPGRAGAPNDSDATGNTALPCRTGEPEEPVASAFFVQQSSHHWNPDAGR